MLTDTHMQDALEMAASAPVNSGLFDVLKRARAAGVKLLDIVLAIVSNRGDVAKTIQAIEDLIPKPPTP